ncbi:MAG: arginine--tRNA ligase [bacterium]
MRESIKIKEKLGEIAKQYGMLGTAKVEQPAEEGNGDWSTNLALVIAKQAGKQPLAVAEEIIALLGDDQELASCFGRIDTAGPGFINFYYQQEYLGKQVRQIANDLLYGSLDEGKGKTAVIEFSSPNIAKSMHVGHIRSTFIGWSLVKLYRKLGYTVIADNHLGDWGTQFGKLLDQYKRTYGTAVKELAVEELEDLYVKWHQEAKDDPSREADARRETLALQSGDPVNNKLWQQFVAESMKEFHYLYDRLGVKHDTELGESFFNKILPEVVTDAVAKGLARESEGAMVIFYPDNDLPPYLIQKSDKAYLYSTTDLATMKYRYETYHPDKIIIVTGNEQALHFQQLFKASELLGYAPGVGLAHVKAGLIISSSGQKFSSREGQVIKLKEIIDEAVGRAKKIIEEKNPELPDKDRIAEAVGIGSLFYNDLSQNRLTDISFDWNKMLDFSGNSAAYLQYTYVRLNSILEKAGSWETAEVANYQPTELSIARELIQFPEAIARAGGECFPNLLANYLYCLAVKVNGFYHELPVLGETDSAMRGQRLVLCKAAANVLRSGLELLGIQTVERM